MANVEPTKVNNIRDVAALIAEPDGAFGWLGHIACAEPPRARELAAPGGEPIELDVADVELTDPARLRRPEMWVSRAASEADDSVAPEPAAAPPASERDSCEPVWVASTAEARRSRPSSLPARRRRWRTAWSAAATAVALLAALFFGGSGQIEATRSARQPTVPTDHGSLLAKQVASDLVSASLAPGEPDAPVPIDLQLEHEDEPYVAAPTELERWARAHLEAGRTDQAVFWGRSLVRATPQDASAYLLLGAALIEAGRASEARGVFRACVAEARRGDASECLAFAGR